MRQYLLELHIPGREDGPFFILEMPTINEPNFYPQSISFQWFRERELNRAFPEVSSGKLKNGMNWMEYSRTVKYCSEHHVGTNRPIKDYLDHFDVDINNVPVCKGVWDFYEKIGYDKKTKRYL